MAKKNSELKYKFIADVNKAVADVKKLGREVDKLNNKMRSSGENKAFAFGSSKMSGPFNQREIQRPAGWEKSPAFNQMNNQRHFEAMYGGQKFPRIQPSPMGGHKTMADSFMNTRAGLEGAKTGWGKLFAGIKSKFGFFGGTIDKAKDNMKGFGTALGAVNPALGAFINKLGPLAKTIGILIISFKALAHAAKQIAHFGNTIEQSKIVLATMMGGDKKAVKTIAQMRTFSRKTQFLPEDIVGSTTMLAKFGVNPFEKGKFGLGKDKHVMDLMSGLAAMPGMKGTPIGLDRAVNAVIAGRDIRPIKALGPEALAAYQKAKKVGTSGSPEFIKVMLTELGKLPKIMGLAEMQIDSMKGLWSTITGYTEEIWMDIAGAGQEKGVVTLWSQVKDILRDIRDSGDRFINYMGPFFRDFGTAIGAIFKFIWEILGQVWEIIGPVLIPAFKILVAVGRIFFEVLKGVLNLIIDMAKVLIAVIKLPFQLIDALFGVNDSLKSLLDYLLNIVLGLQIAFMFLGIFTNGIVEDVRSGIQSWIDKLKLFFTALSDGFKEFLARHPWLSKGIDLIFKDRGPNVSPAVQEQLDKENKEGATPLSDKKKMTMSDMLGASVDNSVFGMAKQFGDRVGKWGQDKHNQKHNSPQSFFPKSSGTKTVVNNTYHNYVSDSTAKADIRNATGKNSFTGSYTDGFLKIMQDASQ